MQQTHVCVQPVTTKCSQDCVTSAQLIVQRVQILQARVLLAAIQLLGHQLVGLVCVQALRQLSLVVSVTL